MREREREKEGGRERERKREVERERERERERQRERDKERETKREKERQKHRGEREERQRQVRTDDRSKARTAAGRATTGGGARSITEKLAKQVTECHNVCHQAGEALIQVTKKWEDAMAATGAGRRCGRGGPGERAHPAPRPRSLLGSP